MPSSVLLSRLRLQACVVAGFLLGCSPPGAVNEKAVLDSTPHSEPAEYAKTPEDYNNHMIDRYTKGRSKSLQSGKEARPTRKR